MVLGLGLSDTKIIPRKTEKTKNWFVIEILFPTILRKRKMLGIRTVNKIRSKLSDFSSVPFCGRKHSLSFLGNFRLKGQCHEIFCFRFFSSITFPQGPENNIRVISNFFENSRRYSQVKVQVKVQICHRCQ